MLLLKPLLLAVILQAEEIIAKCLFQGHTTQLLRDLIALPVDRRQFKRTISLPRQRYKRALQLS